MGSVGIPDKANLFSNRIRLDHRSSKNTREFPLPEFKANARAPGPTGTPARIQPSRNRLIEESSHASAEIPLSCFLAGRRPRSTCSIAASRPIRSAPARTADRTDAPREARRGEVRICVYSPVQGEGGRSLAQTVAAETDKTGSVEAPQAGYARARQARAGTDKRYDPTDRALPCPRTIGCTPCAT